MQNLGGQTKSIIVFSEVAYCGLYFGKGKFLSLVHSSSRPVSVTMWDYMWCKESRWESKIFKIMHLILFEKESRHLT